MKETAFPAAPARDDGRMDLDEMARVARAVRSRYAEFEIRTYGAEWSTQDLILGLVTDVGDLAAAVQRVDGRRPLRERSPVDELGHELADCLWVLLVLAQRYDIDLGRAFVATMDEINAWLDERS